MVLLRAQVKNGRLMIPAARDPGAASCSATSMSAAADGGVAIDGGASNNRKFDPEFRSRWLSPTNAPITGHG
ncbi:MAG: hypothetical protein M3O46_07810 [Myxococcota bacterium]|nr:hypothetical protein [Myxococcota bacterium]